MCETSGARAERDETFNTCASPSATSYERPILCYGSTPSARRYVVRATDISIFGLCYDLIAMNSCSACQNTVCDNALLKCSLCKECYHYGCVNISAKDYKEYYANDPRRWCCPLCNNVNRNRRKDDNTAGHAHFAPPKTSSQANINPHKGVDGRRQLVSDSQLKHLAGTSSQLDSSMMSVEDFAADAPATVCVPEQPQLSNVLTPCVDTITYDRFSELLDSKLNNLKISMTQEITARLRKEIGLAIESLKDDFTKTTDYLADEQNDLKAELLAANNKIRVLEQEKQALNSEVCDIERRMDTLDRASRSRNVEIHCVPQKRNENLFFLVKKLYDAVKLSVSDTDICSVRRVAKMNPNSDRPRSILLTLPSERHRDILMSAFKRYNKENPTNMISTNHLEIPGETKLLYLSEHLSAKCKELHAAARRAAKEHGFKFVWVKFGKIYVRKDEHSNPILIKSVNCLDKLSLAAPS